MPPISGRIAWARQLYEVIDKPMQLLGTQKHIVNTAEGRKIVKNFNRMAAVLVEFEVCTFFVLLDKTFTVYIPSRIFVGLCKKSIV